MEIRREQRSTPWWKAVALGWLIATVVCGVWVGLSSSATIGPGFLVVWAIVAILLRIRG